MLLFCPFSIHQVIDDCREVVRRWQSFHRESTLHVHAGGVRRTLARRSGCPESADATRPATRAVPDRGAEG